jgi:hypothetical protein
LVLKIAFLSEILAYSKPQVRQYWSNISENLVLLNNGSNDDPRPATVPASELARLMPSG